MSRGERPWERLGGREESGQLTLVGVSLDSGAGMGFGLGIGRLRTGDGTLADEADERGAGVAEGHGDTHCGYEGEVGGRINFWSVRN